MRNPIVKLAVVLLIIGGGGWFSFRTFQKRATGYEHQLGLERIRREFLERSSMARSIGDASRYRFEIQQLWKWYFNELNEHYQQFPDYQNDSKFLGELEERRKARQLTEKEIVKYDEKYQATRAFWTIVKQGKYEPLFTARENGLRFDVYAIQFSGDKDPRAKLFFALYGAQRKWVEDSFGGKKVWRLMVNASFGEMMFSGMNAGGKLIGEMRAQGNPFMVDHPERFIEDFPPGVVLGSYALPAVPSEVVNGELSVAVATRSVLSGEEAGGTFVWKFPVDIKWRLPEGAVWEGAKEETRALDAEQSKKNVAR